MHWFPLQMALPVMLALAVIAALLAVVLPFMWHWRTSTHPEPLCRRCGYLVVGLPSQICPECGSDLQRTGIIKPYLARPFPRMVYALLWTMLLPGPALLSTIVLYEQLPRPNVRTARFTIRAHEGLPKAMPLEVKATCSQPAERFSINVTIRPDPNELSAQSLSVLLPEMAYSYDRKEGHERGNNVSRQALATWLQNLGIVAKEADQQAQYVLAVLFSLSQQFSANPYTSIQLPRDTRFTAYSIHFQNDRSELLWYWILAGAAWLVIWMMGVCLLLLGRRRMPVKIRSN